jgi:hypothetical protein
MKKCWYYKNLKIKIFILKNLIYLKLDSFQIIKKMKI